MPDIFVAEFADKYIIVVVINYFMLFVCTGDSMYCFTVIYSWHSQVF